MAQPSAVENVSWLRKFYVKLQTNRWANKKINAVTIFCFTRPVCSKIEIEFFSFQISCPRIVSAFECVRVKRCPRSRIIQNYLSACRRPTTTRSFDCSQNSKNGDIFSNHYELFFILPWTYRYPQFPSNCFQGG